jgi:septal ring factor EnvC (AmiA/AmiB activator)
MRHLHIVLRPAMVAAVGLLQLAPAAAVAQTRQPGEVPYLNLPSVVPTSPPGASGPPPAPPSADANPGNSGALGTLKERDEQLAAIRAEQQQVIENEAKLKREIEAIGDDRRKLNTMLIETAARVRSLEGEVVRAADRLGPLDERAQALRRSLEERRSVIAEVLAVLQRMGRRPPAVLVVRPEDALESLRSAMLLGAVLPEMRQEAATLVADLAELARLRKGIAEERERIDRDLKALATVENPRLAMLIEQRQKQQAEAEQSLAGERQRALQLARRADNLKDLIGTLERNLDSATRNVRVAARSGDEKKSLDSRSGPDSAQDPGRLAPAISFASAKKQLPLPVNGVKIREFGASDGFGGTERGLTIAARNGSQVTSPCDGWVVYAGHFRNYGQLLILNAGDGYHVLLAGMERISVDLGQFVVTGEPVAVMGSRAQAASTIAAGSGRPVLYVEFRKDGTPVDPGPWWAASEVEKVRG